MWQVLLTVTALISATFTLILLFLPSKYQGQYRTRRSQPERSCTSSLDDHSVCPVDVQILVLGDIGRSPRMQYHVASIAKYGGRVQLIGYSGMPLFFIVNDSAWGVCANISTDSAPNPDMASNPSVSIIPLQSPPRSWQTSNKLSFLFFAPLKIVFQICSLWVVLGYRTNPSKWMIVQVGYWLVYGGKPHRRSSLSSHFVGPNPAPI